MGVGSRTDGTNCQPVYLLKTNPDGSQENAWFRLTNENAETEEQKKATSSVLGTRSTGIGRNRVQCFQIPRKQKHLTMLRTLARNIFAHMPHHTGSTIHSLVTVQNKCLKHVMETPAKP